MKTLKTILEFGQYALDELDETGRLLVQRAIEATAHSYAPYSDFHVGAALMLDDGQTIIGPTLEIAVLQQVALGTHGKSGEHCGKKE